MRRRDFLAALPALPLARGSLVGVGPRVARAQPAPPRIDAARLHGQLGALAEFGKNPQGGVSRVAYSDFDRQGRGYVMGLMRDAKLDVSIDAAGNILGRRPGSVAGLKPLLFGSHIDSVPEGGNFDGTVGSLGAIEVARTLAEHGIRTRHPLEVVVWQNEEGGLVGSRCVAGNLPANALDQVAKSGKTIRDGIAFIGGDPAKLAGARRAPGDIAGYLELHIEQGAVLEREKVDIGVVEGIVGIRWWDVTVEGFANHAGTTPMDQRHDAMLAAARFVQMVNRVVTGVPGRQVGTVGRLQAWPGAPNVIPGKVVLSLELRDLDAAKIQSLHARIAEEARAIGRENGTTFSFVETNVNVPAPTDPRVRSLIADSARELGLSTRGMPSGAGHDAQDAALLGPIGMIFVPSVGGISHSPKEYTRPADIEHGVNVLLRTLLKMDAW